MLADLAGIGRDPTTGGYRRHVWNDADMLLREWFVGEAAARGMDVVEDGNGNQLAWWGSPGPDALLTGSHLDSVPDGGAYDGPLGVVSSFAAIDRLRADGFTPSRPVVVGSFADEEGARFGIACAGSQLVTGALAADRALAQKDRDGLTMAEVMAARGRDPRAVGRADWLGDIGTFVELHVEQGRSLVHSGAPVGVATAIWPHGRWRLDFCGEANHAGATLMQDRHDPMQAYAATVLASRRLATEASARATFGRLEVEPGGTNAIPSRVRAWLDARASDDESLEHLVEQVVAEARAASDLDGTSVEVTAESVSPAVDFDVPLRDRLAELLDAPVLPTGAGHDAGVLSAHVPTAMLFVRNPTGVSHSPVEHADDGDCEAGVVALAAVMRELAS
ncbi:allantoate amidohydrolase [Aeromicrobium stalagmiti]|uniref:allantoate amidohydrolase n=1 Tax=Aeromicrobium stalagmiti TaxID=2738988 RepID=UPI0015682CFC|nr:allantoate amidohydrolase [Aeromicrobium stalagmiti]NRQ48790.1 allantoate amidohydrolase [Aeromicrobium stalagmiti]